MCYIDKTDLKENYYEEPDDVDEDAGLGDYPLDTLLIRNEVRTISDILRRIENNYFIMQPDFQRDFIWNVEKRSKLIESVLMRIPLPVFYLAEDKKGRNIVVDGLQRLMTFYTFIEGEFKLFLPNQEELHGKRFEELSIKHQNRIHECNLVLYIVDSKVPEQARLDIFERVNSGIPLTRQQMRNALYVGKATKFLRDEASTELFKEATGNSLNPMTMRDREFVNRFCAFSLLKLDDYNNKEKMDGFLAQVLELMNKFDDKQFESLSVIFQRTLHNNYNVFGRHSFRKHKPNQDNRSVLNASLWDVMSTGLSTIPENIVLKKKTALRQSFYRLMEDEEFVKSITYGPNSADKVRHRFHIMRRAFAEVFDD